MSKRAEWRNNNKEHLSEYNKKWHDDNKLRVSKRKRLYCSQEDVIKHRAEYMEYYRTTEEGREAIRRGNKTRRVSRAGVPMTVKHEDAINDFKNTFGNVCAFTGFELVESSIEHLLPISFGGGNTEYNLVPVELIVNNWKTYKNVFEWIGFMSEELDFTFFFDKTLPYLAEKMGVSVDEYIRWYNDSYNAKEDLFHNKRW